jgi:hypothetical protein
MYDKNVTILSVKKKRVANNKAFCKVEFPCMACIISGKYWNKNCPTHK